MKRIAARGILSLLFLGSGAVSGWAASPLQEGLWEMNMETAMEGLPVSVPTTMVTVKQCVTQKEFVPKSPQSDKCTFTKMKRSGSKVSWEFQCNQDGSKGTGKGEMTFTGKTCSGTSTMTMVSDQGTMTAKTRTKGKFLGPCNGEEPSVSVNGRTVNNRDLEEATREMRKKSEEMRQREERRESAPAEDEAGAQATDKQGGADADPQPSEKAMRKLRSIFGY